MKKTINFGTRRSKLARAQTSYVEGLLKAHHAGLDAKVQTIVTRGDEDQYRGGPLPPVGVKGLFTEELEDALREKRIDVAVHSLKDLPAEIDPAFVLGAMIGHEEPWDVLVTRTGEGLRSLGEGTRIGTSSIRRQLQVALLNPACEVVSIRGNVDTRLRKLESGEVDGLILAKAGLGRLGLADRIAQQFSLDEMVPSAGQGVLAVQCRAEDSETLHLLAAIDDAALQKAKRMERLFVSRLGANCYTPLGVSGALVEDQVTLTIRCLRAEPAEAMDFAEHSVLSQWQELAERLAQRALDSGAKEFLGLK